MPTAPRMPRWVPALRNRRAVPARQMHSSAVPPSQPAPSPSPLAPRFRKRDIILRGPQLLMRGPSLLLRAPKVVWRAPAVARAGTKRLLSSTRMRSREQRPVSDGIEQPEQPVAGPSKGAEQGSQGDVPRESFACTSLARRQLGAQVGSLTSFAGQPACANAGSRRRQSGLRSPSRSAPPSSSSSPSTSRRRRRARSRFLTAQSRFRVPGRCAGVLNVFPASF